MEPDEPRSQKVEIRILSPAQHHRQQQSDQLIRSYIHVLENPVMPMFAAMITDDDNDEGVNGHIKAAEEVPKRST